MTLTIAAGIAAEHGPFGHVSMDIGLGVLAVIALAAWLVWRRGRGGGGFPRGGSHHGGSHPGGGSHHGGSHDR